MSIASEISRISQNVADSLEQVALKGVTVPIGSTSDDLPDLIAQITGGGGGTSWETFYSGSVALTITEEDYYLNVITFGYTIDHNSVWRITWNGTPYECTATSVGITDFPPYALGNDTIIHLQGGNNEPFFFQKTDASTLAVIAQTSQTVSLKIEKQVSVASGLEYETGTYTPVSDISMPSISFSNTHTTIPFAIVMADATGTDDTTQNTNYGFVYGSLSEIGGTKTPNDTGTNGRYDLGVYEYRATGNPTQVALGVTYNNGSSSGSQRGFWVTTTGFIPNSNSTSRYWRSGHTYKWIAVWKPTT